MNRSPAEVSRALFVLPSDHMGGAERVISTSVATAASSASFNSVDVLVLCWPPSRALAAEFASSRVRVSYLCGKTKFSGVLRGFIWLFRNRSRRYQFAFSSAAFVNAFLSISRRIHLLSVDRLVARESTVAFDRFKGWRLWGVSALYRFYGHQDMVVCQTERMRLSVSRNTGGRLDHLLVTLPNPLCARRAINGWQAPKSAVDAAMGRKTRLVWCGRFCPVKAPTRAIQVLACLLRGGVPACLIMIGDGEEREAAEALANELGVGAHVTFVGHVPDPLELMATCDIGMVTSNIEGFPNVILEMLASGVPRVVSTNCAGDLDAIPGLLVVDSREPSRLSDAVKTAIRTQAEPCAVEEYLRRHSADAFWGAISGSEKTVK